MFDRVWKSKILFLIECDVGRRVRKNSKRRMHVWCVGVLIPRMVEVTWLNWTHLSNGLVPYVLQFSHIISTHLRPVPLLSLWGTSLQPHPLHFSPVKTTHFHLLLLLFWPTTLYKSSSLLQVLENVYHSEYI